MSETISIWNYPEYKDWESVFVQELQQIERDFSTKLSVKYSYDHTFNKVTLFVDESDIPESLKEKVITLFKSTSG